MNQSDLSSWMLAGNYVVTRGGAAPLPVRHVVQPAALRRAATPRRWRRCPTRRATSARCSPTTSGGLAASSPWATAPTTRTTTTWTARRCSARASSASYMVAPSMARARRGVARQSARRARRNSCRRRARVAAAAAHVLAAVAGRVPHAGSRALRSRASSGCSMARTVGVRAFDQQIDDQTVTVFGLRRPTAARRRARSLLRRLGRRRRRARRRRDVHARARQQRPRLGRLFGGSTADGRTARRPLNTRC